MNFLCYNVVFMMNREAVKVIKNEIFKILSWLLYHLEVEGVQVKSQKLFLSFVWFIVVTWKDHITVIKL